MLIIPETSGQTAEGAKSKLIEALNEEDTIILLFRSDPQNETQIQDLAVKADKYAGNYGNGMYKVILLKQQDILKEVVDKYFGDDKNIVTVSLRCGTWLSRNAVGKYELSQIDDNIKIGKAFSDADA